MTARGWLSLAVLATAAVAIALALTSTADAHWKPGKHNVRHAIQHGFCGGRYIWCPAAREADRVVDCETGGKYDPSIVGNARGADPYLGLFQAGQWVRERFGYGRSAWAQARMGYRAWRANGYCWTCNRQWPHCGKGLDG